MIAVCNTILYNMTLIVLPRLYQIQKSERDRERERERERERARETGEIK